MSRVLVTDGDERAALAVVRALGRAGHEISVVSTSGRSLAGSSRHCSGEARSPDPLGEPQGFVETLGRYVRERDVDVLIPITDGALLPVLAHRERFEPAVIPFPGLEPYQKVSDKGFLLSRARELGMMEPTVGMLSSPGSLQSDAVLEEYPFPVVLKPVRSVMPSTDGALKTAVSHARDPTELKEKAAAYPPEAYPILVQRRIVGPGVGVFLLLWDGKVELAFAHRRLREKPPSGGVSVLRESIELPSTLLNQSSRLLGSIGWEGVAMVEYKLDSISGEYQLMEVNGRFWGSLQLAIDAGADFPARLVRLALGEEPIPEGDGYRVGVRTRWLLGDVDHLLARLTRSKEDLDLDPGTPGKAKAVWDFLRAFLPPARDEILTLRDPGPALHEARTWVRSLLGNLGRGGPLAHPPTRGSTEP